MRFFNLVVIFLAISIIPAFSSANEVSPWDSYKIIKHIINDLNDIHNKMNISPVITYVERDKSKTPTDVYEKAYILMEKLKKLSEKEGFKIDSEVILPKKIDGRVIPAEVFELLEEVQVITRKINLELGDAD